MKVSPKKIPGIRATYKYNNRRASILDSGEVTRRNRLNQRNSKEKFEEEIPMYSAEDQVCNIIPSDSSMVNAKTFLGSEVTLIKYRPNHYIYAGGNDGSDYSLKYTTLRIEDKKIKTLDV